jgi:type IV secretion system protein VirB4
VNFIDRLLASRGARLSDKQMEEVSDALKRVANLSTPRLSSLSAQLSPELQQRLAPWCEGGVYGSYFDNDRDDLAFADNITTFEVGALITGGLNDVLRAFTDYVFYRLEHMLSAVETNGKTGPTEIYFEEAGFLLEDPLFTERAVDYLMTLAKKNAYLTMTAQSPEPFLRNERLRAAVRDNVATVIFLPNANAQRGELANHYKQVFGLDDNHLAAIAHAIPRQEYCIWQRQTEHFRVAVCLLPKAIVARLRSDKVSRQALAVEYNPADPGWKQRYINKLL